MRPLLTLLVAIGSVALAVAGEGDAVTTSRHRSYKDVVFADVDGHKLQLDLLLPEGEEKPPLLVFIHGGGWRGGTRKKCRVQWAVTHGYAVASISYRFTDVAIFPAQIHDCKGAIRWLRAHADHYGYDASRIAVAGSSAGAHLAVLLGTTGGVPELEGDVGGNRDQSSAVQAVINYFGPTDFILRSKTQPVLANSTGVGSYALLGGREKGRIDPDLARMASPVFYVSKGDPPLITFHGLGDARVLPDQAQRVTDVYHEHGLTAELHLVDGAAHGSKKLFEGRYREVALEFLGKHMRGR